MTIIGTKKRKKSNYTEERDQDDVLDSLLERVSIRLGDIRKKKYLEPRYTAEEVRAATLVAFKDVVEDFKKITVKIL